MEIALALALVAVLAVFVAAPLRGGGKQAGAGEDPLLADLEAQKEAKYREIRDAEIDREQGKLSADDWERLDGELRREAIAILRELDRLKGPADRSAAE